MTIRARLQKAVLALALLAPLIFLTQSTIGAGTAEARCAGQFNATASNFKINNLLVASEFPYGGTCNNDGIYETSFHSNLANWRATLILSNGNPAEDRVVYGSYSTNWHNVNLVGSSSHTRITLCIDNLQSGDIKQVFCGWETNYRISVTNTMVYDTTYYGSNTGY
jgi:hypothetical protein